MPLIIFSGSWTALSGGLSWCVKKARILYSVNMKILLDNLMSTRIGMHDKRLPHPVPYRTHKRLAKSHARAFLDRPSSVRRIFMVQHIKARLPFPAQHTPKLGGLCPEQPEQLPLPAAHSAALSVPPPPDARSSERYCT